MSITIKEKTYYTPDDLNRICDFLKNKYGDRLTCKVCIGLFPNERLVDMAEFKDANRPIPQVEIIFEWIAFVYQGDRVYGWYNNTLNLFVEP